jgi:hypothetical protein
MPVALKLSRLFYDRLGEEVTNEFADVINQIDASYRSELSSLNELNYARFESRLQQGLAELRGEMKADVANLRAAMERGFKEQTRWMFFAWITLLIPIVGLWMRR